MKVVTFFNEKGGTGKTTATALFASWLAYHKDESVTALDFDYPSYHLSKIRDTDQRMLLPENLAFVRAVAGRKPFPMYKMPGKGTYTQKDLESLAAYVRRLRDEGEGYLLLDFPGHFLPGDPVHYLAYEGLIDMFVFPIDSDRQSRTSALLIASTLRAEAFGRDAGKPDGQKMLFLWNRETGAERKGKRDWYEESDRLFARLGIPVAGVRMREVLIARRDPNTYGFIRSTACWPEVNIKRQAPWLYPLFEEIKARIDGTWDDAERERIYGEYNK